MRKPQDGFTLIELMIVVVIIGILAAIAIPNFVAMQDRAKEGSTKMNMHIFQLAAEDWSVINNGAYTTVADSVLSRLPSGGVNFKNPFDGTTALAGGQTAYAGKTITAGATAMATGVTTPGTTVYGGLTTQYIIAGRGKNQDLQLELTSGQ